MHILFNKTVSECRLLGARGGRAHARNLRLKKLLVPPPQPNLPRSQHAPQSVHQDCLLLDQQFPWLADAFLRPRRSSKANKVAA